MPFRRKSTLTRYLGAFQLTASSAVQSGGNDRACGFMPSAAVKQRPKRLLRCAEFATYRVGQFEPFCLLRYQPLPELWVAC